MKRAELEHLLGAAAAIADEHEFVVVGSRAVLGQFPDAPESLLVSIEADLYPRHAPVAGSGRRHPDTRRQRLEPLRGRMRTAQGQQMVAPPHLTGERSPVGARYNHAMPPTGDADTRAALRRWLDTWQRVGPEREAARLQALRALDDAESARIARDLVWPLGTLDDHRGGDDAAGLMTLKALLRKLGPGA